jgi:hypothetical protein
VADSLLVRYYIEAEGLNLPQDATTLLQDGKIVREPMDPRAALASEVFLGPTTYGAAFSARKLSGSLVALEMSAKTNPLLGGENPPKTVSVQAAYFEFAMLHMAAMFRPIYGYVDSSPGSPDPEAESKAALAGKVPRIYPVNFFGKKLVDGLGGAARLREAGFRRIVVFPGGEAVCSVCDFLVWSDPPAQAEAVAKRLGIKS